MNDKSLCVYLRVSADARPSSVDLRVVEQVFGADGGSVALVPDNRDLFVYSFTMPQGIDDKTARMVMDLLADQASVDEVWRGPVAVKAPRKEKAGKSTRLSISKDSLA